MDNFEYFSLHLSYFKFHRFIDKNAGIAQW